MTIMRASDGVSSVKLPEDENVAQAWVYIDNINTGDGGNGSAVSDPISKDLFC